MTIRKECSLTSILVPHETTRQTLFNAIRHGRFHLDKEGLSIGMMSPWPCKEQGGCYREISTDG